SPSRSTSPTAVAAAPRRGFARSASTPSCASPSGSASTPSTSTTTGFAASSPSRFNPTRPGPLWGEKDKRCDPEDPDDATQGSRWAHVIIGPETKLIVSLVVGRRNADAVVQVFTDFYERTGGYLPELITTDGYAVYEAVILDTYGVWRAELGLTAAEEAALERQGVPAVRFPGGVPYPRGRKGQAGD